MTWKAESQLTISEELQMLAKELGTTMPEVVMKVARARAVATEAEVAGTVGWRWYKCKACRRYYNAPEPHTSGKCALCEFRELQARARRGQV